MWETNQNGEICLPENFGGAELPKVWWKYWSDGIIGKDIPEILFLFILFFFRDIIFKQQLDCK